jgi:hypothetical protein
LDEAEAEAKATGAQVLGPGAPDSSGKAVYGCDKAFLEHPALANFSYKVFKTFYNI